MTFGANLGYGLQNVAMNISSTVASLLRHQILWGFVLGFAVAATLFLFLSNDTPRNLPYLLGRNEMQSFNKLAHQSFDGSFDMSYSKFKKQAAQTRVIFYAAFFALLVVVAIALLRF